MLRVYFKCGCIFHDQNECSKIENRGDQFGTWLKASANGNRGYKASNNFFGLFDQKKEGLGSEGTPARKSSKSQTNVQNSDMKSQKKTTNNAEKEVENLIIT